MSAAQEIILFSAAVVVTVMVVSALYAVVVSWSGKGESASHQLTGRLLREICIRSVYSEGGETNVYVSAVLGTFDLDSAVVYVDGVAVDVVRRGALRDSGRAGVFDGSPGNQDLAYLTLNRNVLDGNAHRVTVCIGSVCSSVFGKSFKELSNCQ